MKFFHRPTYPTTTPVSNYCRVNWVYLYDVPNMLESSLLLYYLYSKHHNKLLKNVVPNNVSSKWEIPVVNDVNCVLSTSLLIHLYSMREDIQYEYEHDICSQLLFKYSHPLNYKFESANRDNVFAHRLVIHDNDIRFPNNMNT